MPIYCSCNCIPSDFLCQKFVWASIHTCLALLVCLAQKGNALPLLCTGEGVNHNHISYGTQLRGRLPLLLWHSRHVDDQCGKTVSTRANLWSQMISRPRKTAQMQQVGTAGKSVSIMTASCLRTHTSEFSSQSQGGCFTSDIYVNRYNVAWVDGPHAIQLLFRCYANENLIQKPFFFHLVKEAKFSKFWILSKNKQLYKNLSQIKWV